MKTIEIKSGLSGSSDDVIKNRLNALKEQGIVGGLVSFDDFKKIGDHIVEFKIRNKGINKKPIKVRVHRPYDSKISEGIISNIIRDTKNHVSKAKIKITDKLYSFVYVNDLVKIVLRLMEVEEAWGKTVDISGEEYVSLKDLCHKIWKIAKWEPSIIEEVGELKTVIKPKKKEKVDIGLFKELTGFVSWTPLSEGLKEVYESFEGNCRSDRDIKSDIVKEIILQTYENKLEG